MCQLFSDNLQSQFSRFSGTHRDRLSDVGVYCSSEYLIADGCSYSPMTARETAQVASWILNLRFKSFRTHSRYSSWFLSSFIPETQAIYSMGARFWSHCVILGVINVISERTVLNVFFLDLYQTRNSNFNDMRIISGRVISHTSTPHWHQWSFLARPIVQPSTMHSPNTPVIIILWSLARTPPFSALRRHARHGAATSALMSTLILAYEATRFILFGQIANW